MHHSAVRRAFVPLFLCASVLFASGCTTTVSTHTTSDATFAGRSFSQVTLAPLDVTVSELGATGGVEPVKAWTDTAETLVQANLGTFFAGREGSTLVAVSDLSEDEQTLVREHLALYQRLALSRLNLRMHKIWQERAGNASVGTGLAFMGRYGSDAVLFVTGEDFVSSGGRVAMAVLGAAAGVAVPMGQAVLDVGLVDVSTGEVVWANTSASGTHSFRNEDGAQKMVAEAMSTFPATAGQ